MTGTAPRANDDVRPHEAAALLGIRASDIYRLLAAHELEAYRVGERLVIRRQSVERLRAQRSS